MTLRVDLSEFLTAYLAEAEEIVAACNACLLAIERAESEAGGSARDVRELLRSLHTLKGLTAMMGIEPIVALVHRMESVVRAADRGESSLDRETVARLFDGLRAVEQALAALARGEEVSPAPAAVLEALASRGAARNDVPGAPPLELDLEPAVAGKLVAFEREQLSAAAAAGKRALRVDFVPSPARAAEGWTISSVREKLGQIADIVRVVPISVPVDAEAPSGLRFVLLLTTTHGTDAIAAAVGVAPETVRPITGRPVEVEPDAGPRRGVLRVHAGRVDQALEGLSMLLVSRARLTHAVDELTARGAPTRELSAVVTELTRQLRDMRATILSLRMVPFAEVLERLPLVLRALKGTSGKDVRLVSDAKDAELDKTVAERIFPALVHLLRNAVDHGIESPEERARRGKPAQGTITITSELRSNRELDIRVSDDGAGIDRDAVAQAVGRSVVDDRALLDAICSAGLSTRREATTTSGRGMGMDIVRKVVVDQLGGELLLDSRVGEGTTFTLRVPLTVAVLDAFTVQSQGDRFAVPVAAVTEIVELESATVRAGPNTAIDGTSMVVRRGETIPLVDLSRVLGCAPTEGAEQRKGHALVVRRGGEPVAFRLDRVVAQQEAVVRPLSDPLVQIPGVTGSTDLGDGRVTLVLDLVSLAARLGARREAGKEGSR